MSQVIVVFNKYCGLMTSQAALDTEGQDGAGEEEAGKQTGGHMEMFSSTVNSTRDMEQGDERGWGWEGPRDSLRKDTGNRGGTRDGVNGPVRRLLSLSSNEDGYGSGQEPDSRDGRGSGM